MYKVQIYICKFISLSLFLTYGFSSEIISSLTPSACFGISNKLNTVAHCFGTSNKLHTYLVKTFAHF